MRTVGDMPDSNTTTARKESPTMDTCDEDLTGPSAAELNAEMGLLRARVDRIDGIIACNVEVEASGRPLAAAFADLATRLQENSGRQITLLLVNGHGQYVARTHIPTEATGDLGEALSYLGGLLEDKAALRVIEAGVEPEPAGETATTLTAGQAFVYRYLEQKGPARTVDIYEAAQAQGPSAAGELSRGALIGWIKALVGRGVVIASPAIATWEIVRTTDAAG